jgi:antitoxin ParD1/3/4
MWQILPIYATNDTLLLEVSKPMSTLNISLPDSMRTFIEQKVSQSGYSTASEYIRQLVREDQKRAAQERLERLLMEGIESGPSKDMTAADWNELKNRVWQRHAESESK